MQPILERLVGTTLWLGGAKDPAPTFRLGQLAELLAVGLGGWCVVDMLDDDGVLQRVAAAHIDAEKQALAAELQRRYPPKEGQASGAHRVVQTGKREHTRSIDDELLASSAVDADHLQLLRALGLGSMVRVAVRDGDRVLGTLTVVRDLGHDPLTENDADLLQTLGERVGKVLQQDREVGQSANRLRVAEELLQQASFAILALDRAWKVVFLNESAEELLERRSSDLVGHNIWEEFPEAVDGAFYVQYHRATRIGQAVTFEEYFPPLKRWFQVKAVPTDDHLIVYFTDVTAYKQLEQALRESQERFRAAAQTVGDIIWTNSAEGQMVGEQADWERFTGQSYDSYQGFGWTQHVHPDDAQPTVDAWKEAVRTRSTFVFEHRLRRRDGQWRLCAIRAVPVLDPRGEVREWVGVHTDITEIRQREQERALLLERERRSREQTEEERGRVLELVGQLEKQRDELSLANFELSAATRELRLGQDHQTRITKALRTVNRIGARLLYLDDPSTMVELVLGALASGFGARVAAVWLTVSPNRLKRYGSVGLDEQPTFSLASTIDLMLDSYKVAWVARFRRPFISSHLAGDIQLDQPWLQARGLISAALLPLQHADRLLGVVAMFSETEQPLETGEILATLTALLSAALGNLPVDDREQAL